LSLVVEIRALILMVCSCMWIEW